MNGRAPNWPATGSHVSVCQNCQPNSCSESVDWRYSSKPIASDTDDEHERERTRPDAEHDFVGTDARGESWPFTES